MNGSADVTRTAEAYYDSEDADAFYFEVWGGEDIHIGLYETSSDPIGLAAARSTARIAQKLGPKPQDRILDLGAGFGGAARWLAKTYDCKVTCLNLSEVQNERNRQMCAEQGLGVRVEVVHGAFENLPFEDQSFSHAWSQDAFLHSGDKPAVLREAFRVLKPGGRLVFTDPMQAPHVSPESLADVLARIHLDHMGSFHLYAELARETGFEVVTEEDLTPQLVRHYARVAEVLSGRRSELEASGRVSSRYIDRMLEGLGHWVEAGEAGKLAWGLIGLQRPPG